MTQDSIETDSSGGTQDGANAEDKKRWPITDTEATHYGREDYVTRVPIPQLP